MNSGIRVRLFIMVIIPLVAVTIIGVQAVNTQSETVARVNKLLPQTELAAAGSALIHELQKERGSSVGFISSKGGERFAEIVRKQRVLTEQKLKAFNAVMGQTKWSAISEDLAATLELVEADLAQLSKHRARVDELQATVPENVGYYTKIITELIDKIAIMITESPNNRIATELTAYRGIILAKERAGLERAIGSNLFNVGSFNEGLYQKYMNLLFQQNAYLDEFRAFAPEAFVQQLTDLEKKPELATVFEWRKVLLGFAGGGDGQGIAGADWFAITTQRINGLKTIEDNLSQAIQNNARDVAQQAGIARNFIVSLLLVALAVTIVVGSVIALRIQGSLMRMVRQVRFHANKQDVQPLGALPGGTEIASLAQSIDQFIESDLELARKNEREMKRAQAFTEAAKIFEGRIEQSSAALNDSIAAIGSSVQTLVNVAGSVQGLASSVHETSTIAADEADGLAAASQELAQSIGDLTHKVNSAQDLVSRSRGECRTVQDNLSELQGNVERMGNLAELIRDVVEQTKLLALNANIEATRAGAAGRGFQVVASEVKNLASETASSTDEITEAIAALDQSSQSGGELMLQLLNGLEGLEEFSQSVASLAEQQSATTNEIARIGTVAATSSRTVTTHMGDLEQTVSKTSTATTDLADVAQSLQQAGSDVSEAVREFLRAIRESDVTA